MPGFLLFIASIILAIIAWKKGWKWWSLLPFGLDIVLSFVFSIVSGTVSTSSSNPVTGAPGYFVNFELSDWATAVGVFILILMVSIPRRKLNRPQNDGDTPKLGT